jgi:hypothetical protein
MVKSGGIRPMAVGFIRRRLACCMPSVYQIVHDRQTRCFFITPGSSVLAL